MKTRFIPLVVVCGSLAVCTAPALAEENTGFYVGGSVGASTFDTQQDVDVGDGFESIDLNDNDFGWKAFAGYQFIPWLGVEGGYVDLGSVQDNTTNFSVDLDTDGWTAFAVGELPIGFIDIFAKIGVIFWNVDANVDNGIDDLSVSDDGQDLAYGVGAGFDFSHFTVRAEIERFDIEDVDDLYLFSVGATIQF